MCTLYFYFTVCLVNLFYLALNMIKFFSAESVRTLLEPALTCYLYKGSLMVRLKKKKQSTLTEQYGSRSGALVLLS